MVFWIGILVAVCLAYSAFKLGFYQAWTTLFNAVIAVYVGVRLGPWIESFAPVGGDYSRTLAVLAAGLGTFLILHGISYVFLIGQFEVTFPRGINTLGSALLGFLAGLLIWSFATLVICTTPLSEKGFVKEIGFNGENFEQAKLQSYLLWWCNFVDKIVASGDSSASPQQAVKDLLSKPKKHGKPADVNEPNEPKGSVEPNEPKYPFRPLTMRREPNMIIPP